MLRLSEKIFKKSPIILSMADACEECQLTEFEAIACFFENNVESLKFWSNYGVIASSVNCANCGKPCTLRQDKPICLSVAVRIRSPSHVPQQYYQR